jgi:purine-binding chemotaxis protein CheW
MQDMNQQGDTKVLSFRLGRETYGVDILKVREIIGLMDITAVPRTPAHMRGVVNLRGKIVPVIDMRAKFGLPAVESSRENCIITVMAEAAGQTQGVLVGVLVDSVSEVLAVAEAELEALPSLDKNPSLDFVRGLAKSQGRVTILLDIDKVLHSNDLDGILELEGAAS